ncbi:MAG: leucyl aminopeptidase family protein [Coxiellaceae bacterium]|nr:MAG: leucyl aminopeptidase family protein [Coxiellaceae bacterium]
MTKTFIAVSENIKTIPIIPITSGNYEKWLANQTSAVKNWLTAVKFKADSGCFCLFPDANGNLAQVFVGMNGDHDFWAIGNLPRNLPAGNYEIQGQWDAALLERMVLAWGLGCYQFTPYKKPLPIDVKLYVPASLPLNTIQHWIDTIFMIRNWINTGPDDMGPAELAEEAVKIAEIHGADITQIVGDELLVAGYPLIHAVGRASVHAPRLIDLRWGSPSHPKITLVGKGVCFDSGGLDLKPADGMLLMKKDMAGAAHALGLAHMIMSSRLKVQLRVLIPAVENVVSGDAFHPGDVIPSRKGLRVEITNTDAEGRLVLADALAEAASENPQLIVDFATLTGAASIALGPEIPSLFTSHEELAQQILSCSQQQQDPMWRMPLYKPYRSYLDSQIADIMNSSLGRFAGSITAALFLQEFVGTSIPWLHFDFMAWNPKTKPGRFEGGEAMAIRAIYAYLQQHYR